MVLAGDVEPRTIGDGLSISGKGSKFVMVFSQSF